MQFFEAEVGTLLTNLCGAKSELLRKQAETRESKVGTCTDCARTKVGTRNLESDPAGPLQPGGSSTAVLQFFAGNITLAGMDRSTDNAEKAVKDGSYKAQADEQLRAWRDACWSVTGTNGQAVDRIKRYGELLNDELKQREQRAQQITAGPGGPNDETQAPEREDPTTAEEELWDEARLLRMISSQIEESLTLEYKAAGALSKYEKPMTEITKDVSAMANAAGGMIVYGIAEFQDKAREHLPERLDPINRTEFPKEWLENVIAQIAPRIPEVRIYPVQLGSGPNHVAYVVSVPQSTTAHQARTLKYHRRYNFQSVPMGDHEIRDVMNRRTHPKVRVTAKLIDYGPQLDIKQANGVLRIQIHNESDVLARYAAVIVNAPMIIKQRLVHFEDAIVEQDESGASYRLAYSNHSSAPLFPRASLKALFKFHWVSELKPMPAKFIEDIRYVVYADAMPKHGGTFNVDDILAKATNPTSSTPRGKQ